MDFELFSQTGWSVTLFHVFKDPRHLGAWLYHTFSKLVKKLNDASLCKRSLASELARGPV